MTNVPAIDSVDANLPLISDAAEYLRGAHNALVTEHDNLLRLRSPSKGS